MHEVMHGKSASITNAKNNSIACSGKTINPEPLAWHCRYLALKSKGGVHIIWCRKSLSLGPFPSVLISTWNHQKVEIGWPGGWSYMYIKFVYYFLCVCVCVKQTGLTSVCSWDKECPQAVPQRGHALSNGALQVQWQPNEQGTLRMCRSSTINHN